MARLEALKFAMQLPLLLLAILLGSGAVGAAEERRAPLSAEARGAFLAELEQELSSMTTLRVRFRQERELALLMQPVSSEGILAFVRPDRLHWEWVTPYPSLLVLNRGRVERFDVDDGNLRRLRPAGEEMMRSVALQMSRWLQGRFRDSSELFAIEVYAGPPELIELTPKTEGMAKVLSRVQVELGEDPRVSRVILMTPGGEKTVMSYFEEERGVELPDALFDRSTPLLIGGRSGAQGE